MKKKIKINIIWEKSQNRLQKNIIETNKDYEGKILIQKEYELNPDGSINWNKET